VRTPISIRPPRRATTQRPREFRRALERAPHSVRAMAQHLSYVEIAEANDVAAWAWRNSDARRAHAENIQQIIELAVRHVFDHHVPVLSPGDNTLH